MTHKDPAQWRGLVIRLPEIHNDRALQVPRVREQQQWAAADSRSRPSPPPRGYTPHAARAGLGKAAAGGQRFSVQCNYKPRSSEYQGMLATGPQSDKKQEDRPI